MQRQAEAYPSATRPTRKVSRWNPSRLADEHTSEQLHALRQSIVDDPASANPAHATGRSIYLYAPSVQRKLDAIAWAITHKLAAKRQGAAS